MQLNDTIPLGFKPAKPINILDAIGGVNDLRVSQQNQKMNSMKLADLQRAQNQQVASEQAKRDMAQILMDTGGDLTKAIPVLRSKGVQNPFYLQLADEVEAHLTKKAKDTADLANVNSQIEDRAAGQTFNNAQLIEQNRQALEREAQARRDLEQKTAAQAVIKTANGSYRKNDETGDYELIPGTEAPAKEVKPTLDREIDTFTTSDGYRATTYQRPDGSTYEKRGAIKVKPDASAAAGDLGGATIADYTETMKSGRQYVNVAKVTGKAKNELIATAAKAGLPTVDAAGADALANIDTARDNLQHMLDVLSPYLAQSGTGRLYTGPRNSIESFLQTDPNLTSVGTYRNAAIQAMRSVAGAKGLRINMAEIQMAIDNDIPHLTDTAPVAKAKMEQMLNFLDNAEKGLLVKDRSAGAPAPAPSTNLKSKSTDDLLRMLNK